MTVYSISDLEIRHKDSLSSLGVDIQGVEPRALAHHRACRQDNTNDNIIFDIAPCVTCHEGGDDDQQEVEQPIGPPGPGPAQDHAQRSHAPVPGGNCEEVPTRGGQLSARFLGSDVIFMAAMGTGRVSLILPQKCPIDNVSRKFRYSHWPFQFSYHMNDMLNKAEQSSYLHAVIRMKNNPC